MTHLKSLNFISSIRKLASYTDNFLAGKELKENSGNNVFIHFATRSSLTSNPEPFHKDPRGLYFYPREWLLDKLDNPGFLYGIHRPFYFLVKVPLSSMLKLKGLNKLEALKIARRNGWEEELLKAFDDPKILTGNVGTKSNSVPSIFYNTAFTLANRDIEGSKMPWTDTLKGIKGLYDNTGKGIIHSAEPAQLLVLEPSVITVISQGQNRDLTKDRIEEAQELVKDAFKSVPENGWLKLDLAGKPLFAQLDYPILKMRFYNDGHMVERIVGYPRDFEDAPVERIKDWMIYRIHNNKLGDPPSKEQSWNIDMLEEMEGKIFNHKRSSYHFVEDGKLVLKGTIPGGEYSFVVSGSDLVVTINISASIPIIKGKDVIFKRSDFKFNRIFPRGTDNVPEEILKKFDEKLGTENRSEGQENDYLRSSFSLIDN
jgi:hypothetical protein